MTVCDSSLPLEAYLRRLINVGGPLTVARYMSEVLNNPNFGYYAARDPFGAGGDFITAPEISQMFGEVIGAWCVDCWQRLGSPDPVLLVELGPGRGTLLSDLWRGVAVSPDFRSAVKVCLVEASPVLRAQQQEKVFRLHPSPPVEWYPRLADVPDGALLVIANEFFDALPVHQFIVSNNGWRERLIDCGPHQREMFRYVLSARRTPATALLDNKKTTANKMEVCPSGLSLVHDITKRVTGAGGAALIIDFISRSRGFSLQAVREHGYHDPLVAPGTADLACAVDFMALSDAARMAGGLVHGPLAQGRFLESLGIGARAARLAARADTQALAMMQSALRRLTAPSLMGELFQVMAITSRRLDSVAGLVRT